MAIKVTLRKKSISKGRKSLYLDFYPPIPHPKTGKPTRREFLGFFIYERPKNPIEKLHNTDTLRIAETIAQKRENTLNKPEIYSDFEKEQLRIKELSEQSFTDYFRNLANKRKKSNHDNWISALNHFEIFTNEDVKFAKITEKFLEEFKDYLLAAQSNRSKKEKLSQNSAVSYFNKVKAALKQAYKDGILQTDINSKVAPIKTLEVRKEFLTLEELNKLAETPCEDNLLKRAGLFSALTGLRFSDIQKMTWSEMEYISGQGYFINFDQQKTKKVEVLPISEQAYSFTEGKTDPKEMPQNKKVFEGLKYTGHTNELLKQWINAAGITKHITFHCFRHTYATLQLYNGTDIFTVSKMIGDSLTNTLRYVKIVDQAKRQAADRIKLDL